jgi:hypothetical protein
LTDLILAGQGSSLQAIGSRDLGGIKFTSRPTAGSPGANEWYGIRLKPGSNATLMYCNVDSAYCGVEVQSAFAEIESSWVHDCEFAGVYNLVDGHVNVLGSEVEDNGVYGVRCWFSTEPEEPSRVDANHLRGNGYAGVSFTCAAPTDDVPHRIIYNGIVAGDTGQCGVEISSASDSVRVGSNHISGFPQAGIACLDGSHPYVRWNTVDSNQNGVFCDPSSLPDLGTEEDPGNNSILLGNAIWVRQADITTGPVTAQLNWWGVSNPDNYDKFVGNIVYVPWLDSAPGDGQQSAGPAASLLETGLGRPLPMPMRGTARIPFQVAHAGPVSLSVVDASGRVVRALVRGERAPGRYNVTWDRSDNLGRLMPEGVYFLRFEAGARRDVQKVVVMR